MSLGGIAYRGRECCRNCILRKPHLSVGDYGQKLHNRTSYTASRQEHTLKRTLTSFSRGILSSTSHDFLNLINFCIFRDLTSILPPDRSISILSIKKGYLTPIIYFINLPLEQDNLGMYFI